MIDEPRGAFMYRLSTFLGFPILGSFMDYYSQFGGPKAISMVVVPEGVLTCWSSRLAVRADSGPFHGLLLSFGVPK